MENALYNIINFKEFYNSQISGHNYEILKVIQNIKSIKINFDTSLIKLFNNYNVLQFQITSYNFISLKFSIDLGYNGCSNIIIMNIGELVYFINHNTIHDNVKDAELEAIENIKFYPDYILQFLKSKVIEELYYLDDNLVKVVYHIEGMKEKIFRKHEQNKKHIWPWQKKKLRVVRNEYEPWITE